MHGCDWAAITVWPAGRPPRTLASSGDVALTADQCQYDAGEGPCMSAASEIEPILVPDFATHARVLVLHADSTVRAAQLIEALTTSRQIGVAVGVLMHVHKIDADQAFALLRATSQQLNRKLRLVADDVTHTGTLPQN